MVFDEGDDDATILRRFGIEPDPVIETCKKDIDSVEVAVYGVTCLCVDLPTRIRSKRAAGRPKDLEAIAELEALLAERERARRN